MEYTFYKISKEGFEFEYIGGTRNFTRRKNCHKQRSKTFESKVYQTIRDNGGFDSWDMKPIEIGIFKSKREADIREQQLIDENKAKMNSHKAFVAMTHQETIRIYHEEHREHLKKQSKEYYEKNKVALKEYTKEYKIKNHEKVSIQVKCYMENNREKINKRRCSNRLECRDELNKRDRETKITCVCGSCIRKAGKAEHERTHKHIDYIRSLDENNNKV